MSGSTKNDNKSTESLTISNHSKLVSEHWRQMTHWTLKECLSILWVGVRKELESLSQNIDSWSLRTIECCGTGITNSSCYRWHERKAQYWSVGGNSLCSNVDMSGLRSVRVFLLIWFLPIPDKSTTNVWRLTCQSWHNLSGTTVIVVLKKSMNRKVIVFAELTHLHRCQIVWQRQRQWLLIDWLRRWVQVSLIRGSQRRVSPSKTPRAGSGEHWWKNKNARKISILETSRARDVCRVWFRSCEAAGYVGIVKSVQYWLILPTFSFSTGSEFLKPQFIILSDTYSV